MHRTINLFLPLHSSLRETIILYNDVCNLHIKEALNLNTLSKNNLHKALYRKVRTMYPSFPSALIQCARDNAIEMLKGNKNKKHTIKKRFSSIRFDLRTCKVFLESGKLSISTIDGRKEFTILVPNYFCKYFGWKVKGVTLGVRGKRLVLKIIVEGERPPLTGGIDFLGVDLGLNNLAFLSNGEFISSKHIRKQKRKFSYLRTELQSLGTRSAKQKLKRLAKRETVYKRLQP